MARISKFELSLVASVAFGALIPAESGFAADTIATTKPQKLLLKKQKHKSSFYKTQQKSYSITWWGRGC